MTLENAANETKFKYAKQEAPGFNLTTGKILKKIQRKVPSSI